MMLTRGLVRIAAVLVTSSLLFAACGGAATSPGAASAGAAGSAASQAPAGKVTVDFLYLWSGPEGAALEKVIAKFNASQDRIEVKGRSAPDFQKQLAEMSGAKGFDISDRFGSDAASLASKGSLEPLDDYIARDKFDVADFVPRALKEQQYQGKTYAFPIALHTVMLLYNKKLFSDAGISKPPTTINELKDDVLKLTKVDAKGNLTQLGMHQPGTQSGDYISLAYAFGGGWVDSDNRPTPDNPGNLAAMHFWVDNVVKKYGADAIKKFQSGYGEYASPQNPFFSGKVAMTTDGEWMPIFIKQYAPTLQWGVAPLPYPDGKQELAGGTALSSSNFFIPKNAQHKQEAWEFLKYLVSPPAMLEFTHALGNLPARTSLLGDPTYADTDQFNVWLDSLKSPNLGNFSVPYGAEYGKDLSDQFQLVNTLQATPEQAMAKVKEKSAAYK
jgi:multiple sugar transport system substrate-binding protein